MSPDAAQDEKITALKNRIKILEVEVATLRIDLEAKQSTPPIQAPVIVNIPKEYLKSEKVTNLEKHDPF